jgi:hypothetical protein
MSEATKSDVQVDIAASSSTISENPRIYPTKDLSFNVVTGCLCICGFVSALDTIILSSTLPAIATSLQATTANAYWCSSGFLFAQSIIQLTYAAFTNAFDSKICILVALGVFSVASVLCATAQSIQWLIVARTVCRNPATWTVFFPSLVRARDKAARCYSRMEEKMTDKCS